MNTEITWTEKVTPDIQILFRQEIKMGIIRVIDKFFYGPEGIGTNHDTDQR